MVSAQQVKELRESTGAGMMDCKKALVETNGDMSKAVDYLREKGLAAEGLVESYIHGAGKIGVMIEVNCETDFVAKTPEFHSFVRDLAMQIAAANPQYLNRDEVPAAIVEHEREILRAQALNEGKPEKIIDKMVEGRVDKYYKENCLMEQTFIKDPEKSVTDIVNAQISKIGENIV
ncbi:elongation factor Ts, partial [bacterium]|nr:elongation factor Ts [bacterium]